MCAHMSDVQVPASYIWPYNNTIADPERRKFAGMVACLDEGVGNVTAALKARGILDTSLLIFTTGMCIAYVCAYGCSCMRLS